MYNVQQCLLYAFLSDKDVLGGFYSDAHQLLSYKCQFILIFMLMNANCHLVYNDISDLGIPRGKKYPDQNLVSTESRKI